jgi:para-aminobenzoate synthetase component 1
MPEQTIVEFGEKIREFGKKKIPFIFIIDYEMKKPFICKLEDAELNNIYYELNGKSNSLSAHNNESINFFKKYPVDKEEYVKAFNLVKKHVNRGDSYLLNLTFKSKIETNLSLKNLFNISKAQYKLFFDDKFIVFSPECFIRIIGNQIYSYPMKGTIDARITNAEEKILSDEKELYEHNTIVDLIRNDISMVAKDVEVSKFRYLSTICTNQKKLIQVSSEIKGILEDDWESNLHEILLKILPAGSICGAPKQKTLEIIKKAEQEKRGYYTGIFGIYDGKILDSSVMIRYIEKNDDGMHFRSGGGITALSDLDSEYQELIDKIYVPIG